MKEAIPLLFGNVIEDLSLSGGTNLDKNSMVSLLEDENLVNFHNE